MNRRRFCLQKGGSQEHIPFLAEKGHLNKRAGHPGHPLHPPLNWNLFLRPGIEDWRSIVMIMSVCIGTVLHVYLSVYTPACFRNYRPMATCPIFSVFLGVLPNHGPWFGPPHGDQSRPYWGLLVSLTAALRYVNYGLPFRFYGWRHINCMPCGSIPI